MQNMVYLKERLDPDQFLGETVRIFLIEGAAITIHLTSRNGDYLTGYCLDRMELTIDINDIDFIVHI